MYLKVLFRFLIMNTSKTSKGREQILKKIREALLDEKVDKPFPDLPKSNIHQYYTTSEFQTLEENFAFEYQKAGGNFIYCNDETEFIEQLSQLYKDKNWKELLCASNDIFTTLVEAKIPFVRDFDLRHDQADACITDCEAAIARTGSLLLSSKQNFGRTAPIFFPVHIVVVRAYNIVDDIETGLKLMQNKYGVNNIPSMINLNTGPSRTADIEKTLVTGVHGPKEVYCFFINQ